MLPKSQKISRQDFSLLRGAKVFKNSLFLLKFAHFKGENSKFTFLVSKKVAKNAVERNKLRRWGYQVMVSLRPRLSGSVIAQFSFLKIPQDQEEVSENLYAILKTSKLIS